MNLPLSVRHPIVDSVSAYESDKLLGKLREWCKAERGRQAEAARAIGVSPQMLGAWIAGRKTPSLENGLRIQGFLKRQRGAK